MGHALGRGGTAHKLGLLAGVLALAGCGQVGDLRPPPGQSLPVKPALATAQPTAEELLTPPPIARPQRVDEILTRSEPRRPDRFDLPPPDGGAAPAAETDGQANEQSNTGVVQPQ